MAWEFDPKNKILSCYRREWRAENFMVFSRRSYVDPDVDPNVDVSYKWHNKKLFRADDENFRRDFTILKLVFVLYHRPAHFPKHLIHQQSPTRFTIVVLYPNKTCPSCKLIFCFHSFALFWNDEKQKKKRGEENI